jgi:hypothetical protein
MQKRIVVRKVCQKAEDHLCIFKYSFMFYIKFCYIQTLLDLINGFACFPWQLCSPDGSKTRENGGGGRRETIKKCDSTFHCKPI